MLIYIIVIQNWFDLLPFYSKWKMYKNNKKNSNYLYNFFNSKFLQTFKEKKTRTNFKVVFLSKINKIKVFCPYRVLLYYCSTFKDPYAFKYDYTLRLKGHHLDP